MPSNNGNMKIAFTVVIILIIISVAFVMNKPSTTGMDISAGMDISISPSPCYESLDKCQLDFDGTQEPVCPGTFFVKYNCEKAGSQGREDGGCCQDCGKLGAENAKMYAEKYCKEVCESRNCLWAYKELGSSNGSCWEESDVTDFKLCFFGIYDAYSDGQCTCAIKVTRTDTTDMNITTDMNKQVSSPLG